MFKDLLKYIRSLGVINTPIRFFIKLSYTLNKKAFDFFSLHWPVYGTINFSLPNKSVVKISTKGDDFVSTQAFWKGYDGYEGPSIRIFYLLATQSSTIIDIGANVGYFSLIASKANTTAKVHAFEPVPYIYSRLLKNIDINKSNNIKGHNVAIGNSNTPIKFYLPNSSKLSMAGSAKQGWAQDSTEIEVKSILLDTFQIKESTGKIDLIKMDCEFHEIEALKGMNEILKHDKPNIIMEILFPEGDGDIAIGHALQIENLLKTYNYYFYLISENSLIRLDKLEYNPDERNYLFSTKKTDTVYLPFSAAQTLLKNLL